MSKRSTGRISRCLGCFSNLNVVLNGVRPIRTYLTCLEMVPGKSIRFSYVECETDAKLMVNEVVDILGYHGNYDE